MDRLESLKKRVSLISKGTSTTLLINFTTSRVKLKTRTQATFKTHKEEKNRLETVLTMPHTHIKPRDGFGESLTGQKPPGSKSTNLRRLSDNRGLSKVFSSAQCPATTISESRTLWWKVELEHSKEPSLPKVKVETLCSEMTTGNPNSRLSLA